MASTAPNTGSTLGLDNGVNKTSTSISTNIIIMVNGVAVGAVQTLQINESRNIRQVDEIGSDGHVDSVPNQSTNISGSCTRIRFDRLRVAEAFGRGFVHVHSQVYPFDIVVMDRQSNNQANQISTVIKNVWIKSIDYTYSASDWVITENMAWEAETIFSIRNAGAVGSGPGAFAVAQGGERGIQHATFNNEVQNIEQVVDTGGSNRRGSLDASGLIDLVGSGGIVF